MGVEGISLIHCAKSGGLCLAGFFVGLFWSSSRIPVGRVPKKTVVWDVSSLRKAEEMTAAERERAARLQEERKEREAKEAARSKRKRPGKLWPEKELEAEERGRPGLRGAGGEGEGAQVERRKRQESFSRKGA